MHLLKALVISCFFMLVTCIVKVAYTSENKVTQRFIHDMPESFYVDIGGYDPIFFSQSMHVYARGWKGIVVDASYEKLRRFFFQRPGTISINQAVDKEMFYAQLIQLDQDSEQGINPAYTQFIKKTYPQFAPRQTGQITKIATISMKQICQRFYLHKPVFMNLDIQGNEGRALQSNDWSNSKCRPQILFVEVEGKADEDNPQIRNGQIAVEAVMSKNGYKKHPYLGKDQIWIQEDKFQKYSKKYDEYSKIQQASHKFIPFRQLSFQMMNKTIVNYDHTTTNYCHFDAQTSKNYIHISKRGRNLVMSQLNYLNQQYAEKTLSAQRPILVLQFNPAQNQIIVDDSLEQFNDFYLSIDTQPNKKEKVHLWKLKLKGKKQIYTVYIFDHEYLPLGQQLKFSLTYVESVEELEKKVQKIISSIKQSTNQKSTQVEKSGKQGSQQLQYFKQELKQQLKQEIRSFVSQSNNTTAIVVCFAILGTFILIMSCFLIQTIKKLSLQGRRDTARVQSYQSSSQD